MKIVQRSTLFLIKVSHELIAEFHLIICTVSFLIFEKKMKYSTVLSFLNCNNFLALEHKLTINEYIWLQLLFFTLPLWLSTVNSR